MCSEKLHCYSEINESTHLIWERQNALNGKVARSVNTELWEAQVQTTFSSMFLVLFSKYVFHNDL